MGVASPVLPAAGTFSESARRRGEAWADTGRQFRIAHLLATTRGCRRGGVAGAEPPHKGGPNRPDRPNARREGRGVRSEKNQRSPRPVSRTE